jgi:phosphatidylinositol alpha 1,6-mannosyltransferase
MRVAIVSESFLPSINGVTNSVVRVVETLRKHNHQVLIIAPTKDSPEFMGYPVVTTPRVTVARFPLGFPSPSVVQALEDFDPDLIHAASPFWLGGQALSFAARAGIASVAVYQTNVSGYMQRYGLEFAEPLVDAMVAGIHSPATLNLAPTPETADYLSKLGLPRVALWGRGVDHSLFSPTPPNPERLRQLKSTLAPSGETVLGYVGRLAPEKQVGRLRELLDIPNTRLVIVGDGPQRPELDEVFAGSRTVFLGKLVGEDLADAYRAMDIFVHPGEEETFGQTIQEAQAVGCVVVTANRGGPKHLIHHGVTGFLVEPALRGAYAEQVREIIGDPAGAERLSEAARASVAGNSWEKNNQILLDHYATAISIMAGKNPRALSAKVA